jgi:hypothetical protein
MSFRASGRRQTKSASHDSPSQPTSIAGALKSRTVALRCNNTCQQECDVSVGYRTDIVGFSDQSPIVVAGRQSVDSSQMAS